MSMLPRLSQEQVEKLAEADALAGLDQNRRKATWHAFSVSKEFQQRSLFDDLEPDNEPEVVLPTMAPEEEVHTDYRMTGLSLRAHPMTFHREFLESLSSTFSASSRLGEPKVQ